MTPRLFVRRAARQEIAEGFRWYEERSAGLGHEFLRAVRATLARIGREPELYPFAVDDIRKAPLHRFPYVAYYVVLPFTHTRAAANDAKHDERIVREALLRWSGISVVDFTADLVSQLMGSK